MEDFVLFTIPLDHKSSPSNIETRAILLRERSLSSLAEKGLTEMKLADFTRYARDHNKPVIVAIWRCRWLSSLGIAARKYFYI